ncbi:hypothetical protein P692DRAFT_201802936 [Suillus brevipes Sb2]|nr:hypothetical protein P692DRAFT_201802936 [Suillus brevipes Sb2]
MFAVVVSDVEDEVGQLRIDINNSAEGAADNCWTVFDPKGVSGPGSELRERKNYSQLGTHTVVIASVVKYYMCTRDDDFVFDCQAKGSEQRPAILRYICKALNLDIDMKMISSDKSSVLRLALDGQVITIPKQTGLLSWDIFSKIAPGIICSIFRANPVQNTAHSNGTRVDAGSFQSIEAEQTLPLANISIPTSMVVECVGV